jgi:hypothetical protein
VDLPTGQVDIFDGRFDVLAGNIYRLAFGCNLAPLLRSVVFVGDGKSRL